MYSNKGRQSDIWRPFRADIEGFDYVEGFDYILRVEEKIAPEGAKRYRLLELLNQTQAVITPSHHPKRSGLLYRPLPHPL
ncbi:MAG: DUF4377 domain-containing protein [Deinococcales bacterium]